MNINPDIFKAYDIRGLYPAEINEEIARQIGRGFAAYLKAPKASACRATCASPRRRSPPRSSTGVREQGADVVDYGMLGTDSCISPWSTTSSTAARRSRRRTIPGSTTASRWCAAGALPLSGDAGIGDIRDMIADDRLPPPAATRGTVVTRDVLPDYVEKVMSFIDPAVIKPFTVVLDAGSGMAGLVAPPLFDRLPCKVTQALLRDRRHLPEPRGQSAASRRTAGTSPRR